MGRIYIYIQEYQWPSTLVHFFDEFKRERERGYCIFIMMYVYVAVADAAAVLTISNVISVAPVVVSALNVATKSIVPTTSIEAVL